MLRHLGQLTPRLFGCFWFPFLSWTSIGQGTYYISAKTQMDDTGNIDYC